MKRRPSQYHPKSKATAVVSTITQLSSADPRGRSVIGFSHPLKRPGIRGGSRVPRVSRGQLA